MLTITHTPAEGTLIEGTARGDGTNVALKACGWRWSRTLVAWYFPRTRDAAAPSAVIERTAQQLRDAGHEVTVTVDETRRFTADVEADRIARQEQRAAGLAARAARIEAAADRADQAAHELGQRVPFGQPILVGHHSQGRMTRHYDKVEKAQRAAVKLGRDADDAAAAASTATHTTGARYNPVTVGNRVDRLEAEVRATTRAQSTATGETYRAALAAQLAELTDQLDYWQQIHAEQVADGTAVAHGPDTVRPGDHVKVRGTWYEVIRANKKTISVPSGYSWTNTTRYREIQEHRPVAPPSTPVAGSVSVSVPTISR